MAGTGNLQMAMFTPKSEWIPPMELPDLTRAKKIAIDVETRDPDLKTNGPGWATGNGEVVGYAIAVDDWSGYIPIRHMGGGNLDEKVVNKWLKQVFECPADKIMHNAQYDAGWIKRMGFDLKGRIIDTMLIAALLDENRFSYSLNALSYDLLGKTKSEKGLVEAARSFGVDPKAEMWKLPAMHVGAYAEADAELALELWNYFSVQLGKEDLWGIANLELDLLPCLIEMTWRGVRIDQDRVEQTRDGLLKRERKIMKEIKDIAGRDIEIWAAQSLSKAFDKVGIQYPKTEKGAPSFTKLFLQDNPHPLSQLVLQARNLNKTSSTFINTIMKHAHADGRVHSHINQIRSDDGGTVSGRLSMNSPNLQQIPARDPEMGPMIRSLFLPEEGEQWIRSILGRKCRFDKWEPDTFAMNKALPYKEAIQEYGATTRLKRAYTYKALNRLIQASAADMTKKAMVDLYKEGIVPLTAIHDELALSVTDKKQAEYIADIMTKAVPLEVPNVCDIEIGPSWGEAK